MQLIVGLGNPGTKYNYNRHNVGFMAIDKIAELYGNPCFSNKFNGLIANITANSNKIILLKPQTFMNNSGNAISSVMQFYKLPTDKITVIHDDLDLELAKVKIKYGGGHGGHNGLRHINATIGNKYKRIRIGINRPDDKAEVSNYVLSNFSSGELAKIDKVLDIIADNIHNLAASNDDIVLNQLANLNHNPS